MDKTDIILVQMLLLDSRTAYRDLADKLELSVNAVHKRIQGLIEAGIIRAFTTKVSLNALNAINVIIYGQSPELRFDQISAKLSEDEHTYWVSAASGGILYVGIYLRDMSELDDYLSFYRQSTGVASPTVAIHSVYRPKPDRETNLSRLDYQIIRSMKRDSRKTVSNIAEELGTSAKTVRRRLTRMMENGQVELTLEWYPDASNDIMAINHLHLAPSANRGMVGLSLVRKYGPNVIFFSTFSNLPDQILLYTWSNTMKELNELRRNLEKEEGVLSLSPNILYAGQVFDTWRDNLVDEKAGRPPRP